MRDPKRIDKILHTLKQYWKKHPDLRLGQIIVNAMKLKHSEYCNPLMFYLEDDEFEKLLHKQNEIEKQYL